MLFSILLVPAKVHNVHIASVGTTTVTIAWEHPKDPYTKMNEYQVKYYQKDKLNTTKNIATTRFNQTISDLALQTQYVFLVRLFFFQFVGLHFLPHFDFEK